jgi:predicted GH43/DUF377 family glycosyl hydrolase
MDACYKPIATTNVKLEALRHDRASHGREDPRLFVFREKLHVMYSGVELINGEILTNVMYARLSDRLEVEQTFYPHYGKRTAWEKNWSFFEHGGELFAIYSMRPNHRILRIEGDTATDAYETPNRFPWGGAHMRGGASPVLCGERFVVWLHGKREGADARYNYGWYTFKAEPPFEIEYVSPVPLVQSGPETDGNYCSVVFPGGAILDHDKWIISLGVNDRRIEIHEWPATITDPPKQQQPARRSLPCVYLGERVIGKKAPDRLRTYYHCDKGHGVVCPCGACKTCKDYGS